MTNLSRYRDQNWDPFRLAERLFDEGLIRSPLFRGISDDYMFPVEISETNDALEVKAALPGLKPEDVDITVERTMLRIRGEMRQQDEQRQRSYLRKEIQYGSFERTVSLPFEVNADAAEANFEDGLLKLRLPKAEASRTKQIRIGGSQSMFEGQMSPQQESQGNGAGKTGMNQELERRAEQAKEQGTDAMDEGRPGTTQSGS